MRYTILLPIISAELFEADQFHFEDPFEGIDWVHSADVPNDYADLDFDWNLSDENFSLFDSYSSIQDSQKHDRDIDLEGPCKPDLANHPECDYSHHDKGLCLWMSHVDTFRYSGAYGGSYSRPLSPECTETLIEFFTDASQHPFEYFHDLRRECDSDLKTFCANTTAETSAMACLRSNFDSISSRPCIDELNHLNSWASMNESWWSPSLWRDCAAERLPGTVCEGRSSSGLSEFRDCLDEHRFELSDEKCRKSLFESDLQTAPNPYLLRRDILDNCRSESKIFCQDVSMEDENQLFCLFRASKRQENKDIQFSPACASAVQTTITSMDSDYRLNMPVRKFCRSTIERFCKSEKIDNDKQLHENDSVMNCLKRVLLFNEAHHHEQFTNYLETDTCMRTIRQSVLLASLDWEADSSLHSNCLQDYHKLLHRIASKDTSLRDADSCSGESPQQCLQSHFHDLKNPECQKAVALHSQLEALDQDFKPQLLRACALVLDNLNCDTNSVVDCLYDHVDQIDDPFCRGAIRHDFELSDRDYRLSYSLSLVCAKDRTALCGSVDPAQVLKCMIENLASIKNAECEQDVSRLAFVALSEQEDLIEKSVCAQDVEKFCSNKNRHNNVHSCLLNKLSELSPKCSESMLNLHSSSTALSGMEKVLNNICSSVLVSGDCRERTSSLADKVACIRDVERLDITRVSRACSDQLIATETLLASDYRTNPDLRMDCKTDLANFCGVSADLKVLDNSALMCLVQNRLQIRNSYCKRHIVSTIYRMSDNVQYVPGMRSVCGDDIVKFCGSIEPGNGKLHACLRINFESLSHDCQSQEFVIEQIESIATTTANACSHELATVCVQSPKIPGGQLHCLWRNVDEVSGECRAEIRNEMGGKIGNIWLDPTLYTRCRSTVNEFLRDDTLREKCPSHLVELPVPLNGLIPLPSNYTQAVGGEHVYCLGSFRSKIVDNGCLKAVEKVIREQMKDPVLLKNGLKNQCKRDLASKGICGKTDPFDTAEQWRCLQKEFEQSRLSRICSESVKKVLKTSVSEVEFNPDINSKCRTEINRFYCRQSSLGVIPCLIRKFQLTLGDVAEDSTPLFSDKCTEAMKRLPELEKLGMENEVKSEEIFSPLDQDILPTVESVRLLAAKSENEIPSIELSGSLAFISLGSLFTVIAAALYKLYRWRMKKGYMVIVDKA